MIEETAVEAGYMARGSYEIVDRVAIVDVSGVLVNAAWDGWWTSAYGRITGEVLGAAADPNVEGILLRINSPGGETTNSFETADAIMRAGKQKPVWAVADVIAYSAGYLLAAAASRIYVAPKTGGVGSIGVYCLHLDFSEALKQMGVKPTFVEDPKGKSDGHPFKPLSPEARAGLQAEVDRLADMFFVHVAARRGMEPGDVRQMKARTFDGAQAAIDAGLADRAGSMDYALAQFREHLDVRRQAQQFPFSVAAASATNSTTGVYMQHQDNTIADATAVQPAAAPTASAASAGPEPGAVPDVEEIVALCAIAQLSAKAAHDFISKKKSAKEVRAILSDQRITADSGSEIISQVLPTTGAGGKDNSVAALRSAVDGLKGGK